MSIRGARVLVAGACEPFGQRLVEAFLALGAHVIAADALRTRLDELRARLRQHERLWVAECDFGDLRAAQKLLGDVARDEPLDTAIWMLPSVPAAPSPLDAAVRAGCERFVRAVREVQAASGCGRLLIVAASAGGGDELDSDALDEVLSVLVADAGVPAQQSGLALCGVRVAAAHPAALSSLVALSDPERPAATGCLRVP